MRIPGINGISLARSIKYLKNMLQYKFIGGITRVIVP